MYIVYFIINNVTKNKYIGFTSKSVEQRWKKHCVDSNNRKTLLSLSVKKYGEDNFSYGVIESFVDEFLAKQYEQQMILLFQTNRCRFPDNNGLNLTDGGEGSLGIEVSQETRDKISKANKGKTRNNDQRKRISEGAMGNVSGSYQSEKTKKIKSDLWKTDANPMKGKFGEEHHSYGVSMSEERKQKLIEVNQISIDMFDKDGTYLKTFKSNRHAAEFIGHSNGGHISSVCKGKRKTAGGYIWKYTKKDNINVN